MTAPLDALLQPFFGQSAAIRSILAIGCGDVLEALGNELPAIARSVSEPLCSLTQEALELFEPADGEVLLLVPAQVLKEQMAPPDQGFSFRAVAALQDGPDEIANAGDWKLRRSLFDLGLICVGSVPIRGRRALCFLASDAVQSFDVLNVEPRGCISMSVLKLGAGFANQLFRYACVKLYALRHGLTAALPAWEGNELFGLADKACEGLNLPELVYPGFAENDREIWEPEEPQIDIDLRGYFQEIPECWRRHRSLLRRMFQLRPVQLQAIEGWRRTVTQGGTRTLVAVHVRRGDYRRMQGLSYFRLVPEEWYLDWLREIWPTLRDPVLFVGTDEPEAIRPLFHEFETVSAPYGVGASALPNDIVDFEVMRQSDYLAICNSSYSRMAAILAPAEQKCFLPSFSAQSFVPYEPWMDPAFWRRFDASSVVAVTLRRDLYVPVSSDPIPIPGISGGFSAARICVSGWHPADRSGVRASNSDALIRFRADARAGTRINLLMRLAVRGLAFHIRFRSGSGDQTECSFPSGSERPVVLPCTVEPDRFVTIQLSAIAETLDKNEASADSHWMLKGILYFDPKRIAPRSQES